MFGFKNFMIIFTALFAVAFPVGLVIWWKKKSGAKLWPVITGALCFLVFAMGLEQIAHSVFLGGDNAVSNAINSSPALFALYTSLAAGIFEETGRLFGFRVLLKNRRTPETSVAYGIGHGGIEVILILGATYIVYALSVCGVSMGSAADGQIREIIDQLYPGIMGMACFERICAVTTQIALSVFVFYSVRTGKTGWFLLAVLCHAFVDIPAALCQIGIVPIWAVELFCAVFSVVLIVLAVKKYGDIKKLDAKSDPEVG